MWRQKLAIENPAKLGTDRWAALVASWQIKKTACVVVNAGTAVTIDALSQQGEFLGGLDFTPGVDLMQKSLGMATAQLPSVSTTLLSTKSLSQHQDIFAKNTQDAMRAGAINASCGAILQMHYALNTQSSQLPFILISRWQCAIIKR